MERIMKGMEEDEIKDNINPNHYKKGDIEVIDFILDQKMSYTEGNIIKYVSRYKFKNGIEDLNKAKWYIEKLIEAEEMNKWMQTSITKTSAPRDS